MIITNKSEPKYCINCTHRWFAFRIPIIDWGNGRNSGLCSYLTFYRPCPHDVFHNLYSMQCAFSSFEFKVGKTGSKNLQLVLQHCCKTSRVDKRCWEFYHPRIEPVLQHSGCCRLRKLVAKSSRFAFCNKICSCCAFYWSKANLFCNWWRNSCLWRHFCVINGLLSEVSIHATWIATPWLSCKTGLSVGGTSRNFVFQLVL